MKASSEPFAFPLIALEETDSTNQYLIQLCNEQGNATPEFTTVTAQFQSSGKGQRGNSWESEPGKNLLFSFVAYPTFLPARRQFILSQIASLAVKEELNRWSNDFFIKWPNDIYYREKKIAGMLIENDLSGAYLSDSIIGIGLNLNQATFLSDAPNPVSLFQILHREVNREEVLRRFLTIFYARYISLLREEYDEIRACYRSVLYRGEGFYRYQDAGGMFEARVRDIEPTGHLLLESRDGSVRRYAFKEVAFR